MTRASECVAPSLDLSQVSSKSPARVKYAQPAIMCLQVNAIKGTSHQMLLLGSGGTGKFKGGGGKYGK